ncbi:hypothetical protein [uncultured Jatrophihabitans sp.]|uniref:hypothetical protein n=1 Tax=uncultured Jatrophihabitans sp. TaxID=1610747 RepID=UPI0035C96E85
MAELLPAAELPKGFRYPPGFLRIVGLGLVDLEPWLILQGQSLLDRQHGLQARYPSRRVVPFAHRTDRDDVACWDLDAGPEQVSVLSDFDAPGFEQGEIYPNFYGWFRSAVEDCLEWDD